MPYLDVRTNVPLPEPAAQQALLEQLTRVAAEHLGKPERIFMTRLSPSAAMTFAGTPDPCACIDVHGIGTPSPAQAAGLCSAVSGAVAERLGVQEARVFFIYSDVPRQLWGVGGNLLA